MAAERSIRSAQVEWLRGWSIPGLLAPPIALIRRFAARRWWREQQVDGTAFVVDEVNRADLQTIADGVGDVITRRYQIALPAGSITPSELIDRFRRQPDTFAPGSYAEFDIDTLDVGRTGVVRLPGPWNGPIEVVHSSSDRIRLATCDGHMEAGWIDFIAATDPQPEFRIESTARAGDSVFWALHDVLRIGRWVQADMWARVLENAVRSAGVEDPPRVEITTYRH